MDYNGNNAGIPQIFNWLWPCSPDYDPTLNSQRNRQNYEGFKQIAIGIPPTFVGTDGQVQIGHRGNIENKIYGNAGEGSFSVPTGLLSTNEYSRIGNARRTNEISKGFSAMNIDNGQLNQNENLKRRAGFGMGSMEGQSVDKYSLGLELFNKLNNQSQSHNKSVPKSEPVLKTPPPVQKRGEAPKEEITQHEGDCSDIEHQCVAYNVVGQKCKKKSYKSFWLCSKCTLAQKHIAIGKDDKFYACNPNIPRSAEDIVFVVGECVAPLQSNRVSQKCLTARFNIDMKYIPKETSFLYENVACKASKPFLTKVYSQERANVEYKQVSEDMYMLAVIKDIPNGHALKYYEDGSKRQRTI